MTITLHNISNYAGYKQYVFNIARGRMLTCKFGADELILDEIVSERYDQSLKKLCLEILSRCKIEKLDDEIIVTTAEEDNKAASFITYGDLNTRGSNIFIDAFKNIF